MFGWAKKLKADFNEAREQTAIDKRNAERRELCAEFARNKARQGAIVARLAELSGEANKEAVALRLAIELEGIDRRAPQAEVMRFDSSMSAASQGTDHFQSDLKHFRADFCGTVYPEAGRDAEHDEEEAIRQNVARMALNSASGMASWTEKDGHKVAEDDACIGGVRA